MSWHCSVVMVWSLRISFLLVGLLVLVLSFTFVFASRYFLLSRYGGVVLRGPKFLRVVVGLGLGLDSGFAFCLFSHCTFSFHRVSVLNTPYLSCIHPQHCQFSKYI